MVVVELAGWKEKGSGGRVGDVLYERISTVIPVLIHFFSFSFFRLYYIALKANTCCNVKPGPEVIKYS